MAGTVLVEYLYLNLDTCGRCIGTDHELTEVLDVLTPALRQAGYGVEYRRIEMATEDLARQYRFLSSPTIRVNGQDIGGPVRENDCGCCGEIAGTDVACRVWEADGQTFEIPPKEALAEGILRAVFGNGDLGGIPGAYELPDNLKAFYAGKGAAPAQARAGGGLGRLRVGVAWQTTVQTRIQKQEGIMALFGRKKEQETPCCEGCGGCTPRGMEKAEEAKAQGPSVKVLGSGCAKCNELEAAARAALSHLGMDTSIDHVTDFAKIAAYGVMTTPALVVDGKVVSYGKVLKTEEVVRILQKVR